MRGGLSQPLDEVASGAEDGPGLGECWRDVAARHVLQGDRLLAQQRTLCETDLLEAHQPEVEVLGANRVSQTSDGGHCKHVLAVPVLNTRLTFLKVQENLGNDNNC